MALATQPVAVSAPGKVLFSGGFLVLDRKHTGLVFGLNARIHVRVEGWNSPGARCGDAARILVQSPQFLDARWLYSWDEDDVSSDATRSRKICQILTDKDYSTSSNKFVETTLHYVFTYLDYIQAPLTQDLKITILADDDYYSHNLTRAPGEFTKFGVSLRDAHKTGLGSSAALVTALVASLLARFTDKVASTDSSIDLQIVHNLAQASHCAAQGKVGSGFDVAAAVYGSCLYRRFTPTILEDVGDISSAGFAERLYRCVADFDRAERRAAQIRNQEQPLNMITWDTEILRRAVQIPRSLRLVMCDVDCGSETPGMVRKVLAWRRADTSAPNGTSEATQLWEGLQKGTDQLCAHLKELSNDPHIPASYEFSQLRDIISHIRQQVRTMSARSSVPIEPPIITDLLDFCTSLPGVIGGVAPGAGGYDAIALFVKNDESVIGDLQRALKDWQSKSKKSVTEGPEIGRISLLGVKQDFEGLKVEDPLVYRRWTTS